MIPPNNPANPPQRARSHTQMTAVGCGIGEVNLPQHSIKQREKCGLGALFGWSMREGLCEVNPVMATNNPAQGIMPRDRVLTDQELAAVWRSCADDDFGRIVKLLILTGCRREEIGGLKWSEIDLDTGVMTIPGERTKNHRTLILTLPPMAIDILRSIPVKDGRDFIFGSYSARSYATTALHLRINMAEGRPLPHWTLHDLRRTFRTGLGRLGVQPHVAERCVGHVQGGVERIYDRRKYQDEIKFALVQWAYHVTKIVR
jgi:integrase